jgi:hypothetical protein
VKSTDCTHTYLPDRYTERPPGAESAVALTSCPLRCAEVSAKPMCREITQLRVGRSPKVKVVNVDGREYFRVGSLAMVGTFVAVVLGGVISVLSQVALDVTRARAQARKNRKEIMTAVRVIRFMLYSAQHMLREALETGRWWSPSDELNVAAAGEDLRALAELLPEEHWRIYTGAARAGSSRPCRPSWPSGRARSGGAPPHLISR